MSSNDGLLFSSSPASHNDENDGAGCLMHFKCNENAGGWGPNKEHLSQFKSMPFQPFNKGDKIGKVADWTGTIYNERRFGRDARYTQQYFSGQVGTQYAFDQNVLDDDGQPGSFQLVDTAKQQKTSQQRANRIRQMQNSKRQLQKEREKRKEAGYAVTQNNRAGGGQGGAGSRGPQQWNFGPNRQQWRGQQGGQRPNMGGGNRWDQRGQGQGAKNREPSVQVRPDWQVLEELDFPRLQKLNLPNVSEGETIPGEEYGALEYYDRTYDKLTTKTRRTLTRNKREFFRVTTTDDPIIVKLSKSPEFNVFGTDTLIAALMCASRSVYSWDIVVERVGNKLFFDRRSKSYIDYPTVSETAIEPPQEEGNHINSPEKLSLEAMFINASFGQQVLRQGEDKYYMNHKEIPFLENADSDKPVVSVAYKYRKWDLGNNIVMLCRCEHDGVMMDANNEKHFLTIRAFNEWDSRYCGGLEWTSKMDSQRGAVLATELKNNSCKLARWTMQAYLAGSDYLKFGYVSRAHVKDSSSHVILSTQQFRPAEFAAQINLNIDNAFGVLRVIIDLCMKQPAGKYLLLKDPNKGVVRLYKIPADSFESDLDEEDVVEEDEDEETEN